MRILVTGGAGFIGSHVQDECVSLGHEVFVLDNLSTGKRENVNSKAQFFEMDIRSSEIEAFFSKIRPEIILHLAAQMDVRKSVADPCFDLEVNGTGFLNLLEAGRRNGLKKVVFASTGGAMYGEQKTFPALEEDPAVPESPYGVTKLLGEKYLSFYHSTYGISYAALRLANVYGPRQNPHGEAGVVAIFCEKMLRGKKTTIFGEGQQTRDYVFVTDVVHAFRVAMEATELGIFNVGTGVETSVKTLWTRLHKCLPQAPSYELAPFRLGEQQRSVISFEKIKSRLGWTPQTSLDKGLRLTLEFFRGDRLPG